MNDQREGAAISMTGHGQQFLSFKLGAEEYGIDILKVQEIRGWQPATPIPNMPDYILGVINLRGTVVPVVDLRDFFGMGRFEHKRTTVIIVVHVKDPEQNERTMGLVVDAVSEVHDIVQSELQPAPAFGGACDTDFIMALATKDERMIVLLEVDRLMHEGVLTAIDADEGAGTDPN